MAFHAWIAHRSDLPLIEKSKAWFEILAPGQWTVPLVCNSPHSGNLLPPDFASMSTLPEDMLHMSEDSHVDELFMGCLDLGVPLLKTVVSRSYLDLNREPYEFDPRMFRERLPSYMNTGSPRVASGLGTIPRTVGDNHTIYAEPLELSDALNRIESIYRPYHRTLAALLDEAFGATGQVLLIDCHSMPSSAARTNSGNRGTATIDIALGDRHGCACDPSIVEIAEQSLVCAGLNVQRNKPYSGGYITEIHGKPRQGRHALQIEINRALYMNETTRQPRADFIKLKQTIDLMLKNMCAAIEPWTAEKPLDQAAE
jgi:N-formylglutamate amidohydrolase